MAYTDSVLTLSGSTNGGGILLASTSSPGTLIHTSSSTSGVIDYVGLLGSSDHTADVQVFYNWAGNTEVGVFIPFQKGAYRLMLPRPIWGGTTIKMWASVANVIWIYADGGTVRLTTA